VHRSVCSSLRVKRHLHSPSHGSHEEGHEEGGQGSCGGCPCEEDHEEGHEGEKVSSLVGSLSEKRSLRAAFFFEAFFSSFELASAEAAAFMSASWPRMTLAEPRVGRQRASLRRVCLPGSEPLPAQSKGGTTTRHGRSLSLIADEGRVIDLTPVCHGPFWPEGPRRPSQSGFRSVTRPTEPSVTAFVLKNGRGFCL
jgi:hypothetical protein